MCAFVLALALLAGIGIFVALGWARVGLWLAGAGRPAGSPSAAVGVAIGALAQARSAPPRCWRFLATLPLAFLALVPPASVSGGLRRRDRRDRRSCSRYSSALQALDCAVNEASPGLGVSLVHLLG